MDPQHHPLTLSYSSQKDVFRSFGIEKRKSIALRCPNIRNVHRKCGFRIGKTRLELDKGLIRIDNLTWKFKNVENGVRLKLPSGKYVVHPEPCHQIIQRLLEFLFNREGTWIWEFQLINFPFDVFNDFKLIRISDLWMYFSNEEDYDDSVFSHFQGRKFRKLKVVFPLTMTFDEGIFEKHSIETERLEITVNFSESLPNVPMSLKECVFWEPIVEYCEFQNRLRDIRKHPIGFRYKGMFHKATHCEIRVLWTLLRNWYTGTVQYTSGIPGLCFAIDEHREVFVTGREYEFYANVISSFEFSATIQQTGESRLFKEMSWRQKLFFWDLWRRQIVFFGLTKLGIFISNLFNVPVETFPEDPIDLLRFFQTVHFILTALCFVNAFHVPMITISFQLSFLLYNWTSLPYFLIILLLFVLIDLYIFPWKTYPKRLEKTPLQVLVPCFLKN